MTYWSEFRTNGHVLLACAIGLALGSALNHYASNLFGPALLKEFGWTKAQLALTGAFGIVNMLLVPFWGRFTDRFGPRAAASIGFIAVPLSYLAYSMMGPDIRGYYAITVFHQLFGVLTTTIVFARVIIERFEAGRGMALSILMSGAPLAAAILTPVLGRIIADDGWRAGYQVMAAISAIAGVIAILAIGKPKPESASPRPKLNWAMFKAYAKQPAFLLLVGGMTLVNIPQILVGGQLNVMLEDNHSPATLLAYGVTIYSLSVVAGRFMTGLALDKVPAHLVAIFTLGLPAIGYFALALPFDPIWLLAGAILLIGLAQGAEGDLGAYIASKKFELGDFSFVYSFLILAMGVANALGSAILAASLKATDSFNIFLIVCAVATLLGTLAFTLTGRTANLVSDEEEVPES